MHGRLRIKTTKEKEVEQKIKEREKAYHFKHLSDQLFAIKHSVKAGKNLDESLNLTTEILLVNPDFYTAWNIRKETLLALVQKVQEDVLRECEAEDIESNKLLSLWKDELAFTIQCLKKNEKSYSVWQHRIWILSNMSKKSEYENELKLCNMFLSKDERNFHCWDYRSYICELAGVKLEDEMVFTTDMIKSNFSNFSAWHRRHKVFLKAEKLAEDVRPKNCDLCKNWEDEYKMILDALFTDPTDQSPWKYHNWLVANNYNKINNSHLNNLQQLAELEPDNKWVANAVELVDKAVNK